MGQHNGDFFRTCRFGGFHKEDVMQYIESFEQLRHAQQELMEQRERLLRESRQEQLRWMEAARLQRRRSNAANQVQRELEQFKKQLEAAQETVAQVEHENTFLREKIRVLEEAPNKIEPAVIPLEQLTFQLFLDNLDEEEGEFGVVEM